MIRKLTPEEEALTDGEWSPDPAPGITRFEVLWLSKDQPQGDAIVELSGPVVSEAQVLYEILHHIGLEGRQGLEVISVAQVVQPGEAILAWLRASGGRYTFNRPFASAL